jgi:hypothetical protein
MRGVKAGDRSLTVAAHCVAAHFVAAHYKERCTNLEESFSSRLVDAPDLV